MVASKPRLPWVSLVGCSAISNYPLYFPRRGGTIVKCWLRGGHCTPHKVWVKSPHISFHLVIRHNGILNSSKAIINAQTTVGTVPVSME
mgnify:FL=1